MSVYDIPSREQYKDAQDMYTKHRLLREAKEKSRKEYSTFIENSTNYFVCEAINKILQESLRPETSDSLRNYGKSLVTKFVLEEGAAKIIHDFEIKSELLSGIAKAIQDSMETVKESCDKDDCTTFKIGDKCNKDFFDKLEGCNTKKVAAEINRRVMDSVDEFVKSNAQDKQDLEDLAASTTEKINAVRGTAQEAASIKQELTNRYRSQANVIRSNRPKNIYEQLVYNATSGIVSSDVLRESYQTTEGKLNVSKIMESVEVMYTFLETLNTAKIANINEAYIKNVLKSVK